MTTKQKAKKVRGSSCRSEERLPQKQKGKTNGTLESFKKRLRYTKKKIHQGKGESVGT